MKIKDVTKKQLGFIHYIVQNKKAMEILRTYFNITLNQNRIIRNRDLNSSENKI